MEVLEDKIGKVVVNNGVSLARELDVTDLKHVGNFQFSAKLWGVEVDIVTEPVDEDATEIRILSVRMEEKHLQKAGIYRNKVGVCYHMQKGGTVAESYIEIPVSAKRYEEITQGLQPKSKVWQSIVSTLKQLTYLQGYDRLGSWSVELTVMPEEDD